MKLLGYDYKARKKKVEEILDGTDAVREVERFPRDEDFTYTNGYKAWAGAIFVDLRDSTSLFKDKEDVDIAKVIRGFTSEIIEILRKDTDANDLKEIGIRGDCVYAIYSAPLKTDLCDILMRAVYINTYILMLNKLLEERNLPTIKAGIGLNASPTLSVKAGRKSSGVNNLVWIGTSVPIAAKLADLGDKDGIKSIVMSDTFYDNIKESTRAEELKINELYEQGYNINYGFYHHGNAVIGNFEAWILDGMKDE
ncbi:adenylate/guanylate cyclase domain-containing protein [Bacillus glycinifermentans]|uniref:adenylate/guanylate cyclase domain-containing protein n=1 Tax=Bacillus TaxID=1386 RepID=UPI0015844130|nr:MULTISPECIES: adenylate/guanylate cyclase domain-containing protein [Bacillus]NUJ17408.1 adenylate/guanylate cyclase domain-containing protein [Bacillus glycinifermentans]GIN66370.1 adenylate cyclase [Bacillus sonorensis]